MGKKDYGWRESKKSKKTEKKTLGPVTIQPTPVVEVVPKGKKKKQPEEL